MKVGDYVRFKTLSREIKIGKVIEIIEPDNSNEFSPKKYNVYDLDNNEATVDDYIIKSSPNIIDLIEVGDFVKIEFFSNRYLKRLERIFEVDYVINKSICFENGHCQLNILDGKWSNQDEELKPIIKSIVTKEQFESMENKIGE